MNIDQENTIRALKDETLIATRLWCKFGFHVWERWSDPYVPKGGYKTIQHRYCVCCHNADVRQVKIP